MCSAPSANSVTNCSVPATVLCPPPHLQPYYYWWEVKELLKKFFFTGALFLFLPGSPSQLVVGFLFGVFDLVMSVLLLLSDPR